MLICNMEIVKNEGFSTNINNQPTQKERGLGRPYKYHYPSFEQLYLRIVVAIFCISQVFQKWLTSNIKNWKCGHLGGPVAKNINCKCDFTVEAT
jgi:hypothetical protein